MGQLILEGIMLGLLLSIAVGPVFFLLIDTTLEKGKRVALFTDIGILASDALYIVLFYFGAMDFLKPAIDSPYMYLVGGVIFMAFGAIGLLKKRKTGPPSKKKAGAVGAGLLTGFLANALNPSVLAFWLATVALAVSNHPDEPQNVLYLFIATLGTVFSFDLLKIYLADWLRQWLSLKVMRILSKVVGIAFIAVGAGFIVRFFIA